MEHNFDQLISPLGKTLLPGRTAAFAVLDALDDMAQRCESSLEEVALRRAAYDLTIAVRTDEVGANEENLQAVCDALAQASAISVFGHDEESFWIEITVPGVFEADDFDSLNAEVSIADVKRKPVIADEPTPPWLVEALLAAKEERDRLVFEDFAIDKQRFFMLADLFGAFKRAAEDASAEFVFKKPELPKREHGSCYLVAERLTLRKEDIQALFPLIAQASSFGITYCADDRVRLGVEVSFVYDLR